MTSYSKIFTEAELEEISRRKEGKYKDKFGLFSARIKPKIQELLEHWFPRKQELEELIKAKKKSRGKNDKKTDTI